MLAAGERPQKTEATERHDEFTALYRTPGGHSGSARLAYAYGFATESRNGQASRNAHENPLLDYLGELISALLERVCAGDDSAEVGDGSAERTIVQHTISGPPKRFLYVPADH